MSEFKYTQEFIWNSEPTQTQILYDGKVIYKSQQQHLVIGITKFCNEVMRPWMESMSMGFHQLMLNQRDEMIVVHEKALELLNDIHGDEINKLQDEITNLKSELNDRIATIDTATECIVGLECELHDARMESNHWQSEAHYYQSRCEQ